MPTISEAELSDAPGTPCSNCSDYEGAIWLCGEGSLCEHCFAKLAGIDESELYKTDPEQPLLDFEVPSEHLARAKAKLMHERGQDAQGEV